MSRVAVTLTLAALLVSTAALAEVRPQGGQYDHRIRYVDYNPDDVVSIVGHFGFSTAIELAPGEEVQDIALGDSLAWDVAPRGHFIFLKPRESRPTTNMTVVTNRRAYQFWLDAHPAKHKGRAKDVAFAVRFRYPEEQAREASDRHRIEQALASAPIARNWNYWACGARGLRPSEAFDDGRFTYLRFPPAQAVPAAYTVESDGTETLASGVMHGDRLVLQLVARRIVLRRGDATACVDNRGFSPYGAATPSGTVQPTVERVLKGAGASVHLPQPAPAPAPAAGKAPGATDGKTP